MRIYPVHCSEAELFLSIVLVTVVLVHLIFERLFLEELTSFLNVKYIFGLRFLDVINIIS